MARRTDTQRQPARKGTGRGLTSPQVPAVQAGAAAYPTVVSAVREAVGRPRVVSAAGVMVVGLGVAAVGAIAIGALAIGRVAVGRLALGHARIGTLEVDELRVRRLHVVRGDESE